MADTTDIREANDLAAAAADGLTPSVLARLRPHLAESIVILNGEGRVSASLSPPDGLLGLGTGMGAHFFEYCSPEDLPRALEMATEALNSEPGWSMTWSVKLRDGLGEVSDYEMYVVNCCDDEVVKGYIVRLRPYPKRPPRPHLLFASELDTELETLAGVVPLPIIFFGSDGRVYYLNDAARRLAGDRVDRLEREGLAGLATEEDRAMLASLLNNLLDGQDEQTVIFKMASEGDGRARMIEARVTSRGRDANVIALVATLVDVTERIEREHDLQRRAMSDSLTGLANRRQIEAALTEHLAKAPGNVAAMYIDLDGFKSLNDTFGHDAGDQFLVQFGKDLTALLGTDELVGRLGGDEFVVIASPERAGDLADPIREVVHGLSAAHGSPITVSVGIAHADLDDTPRNLLRRADSAMYRDKRRGNAAL